MSNLGRLLQDPEGHAITNAAPELSLLLLSYLLTLEKNKKLWCIKPRRDVNGYIKNPGGYNLRGTEIQTEPSYPR